MESTEKLTAQKIIDYLESNKLDKVEEMKLTLHENLFSATKDAWPVNGFFDYYMSSGSLRVIEVLVSVKEPHDRHLLDRLAETLRGPHRLKALQFLGYLAKNEPPWLYKIQQHSALRELLKVLKTENDEVVVVNAALVLAAILPVIPATVPKVFDDICTIFNRLTVWHTMRSSSSQMFLIHLRLAIAALFHRLYGMFPVNFLSYMRSHIGLRDPAIAFQSSLKPLLETVRMNPLLVTATKESEMQESRWKGLDTNDILGECYQLVLSMHPFRDEEVEDFWKEEKIEGKRSPFEVVLPTAPESILCENLQSILSDANLWMSLVNTIHEAIGTRSGRVSAIPHTPVSFTGAPRVSTPLDRVNIPPRFPLAEQAVEATPENTPWTTPVKELDARIKAAPVNPQVARLSGRTTTNRAVLAEGQTLPEKPIDEHGQMDRRGSLLTQKLDMLAKERRASSEGREDGKSIVERKNVFLSPLKIEARNEAQGLASPVDFVDTKQPRPRRAFVDSRSFFGHSDVVTQEDREVSSVLSPSEPTTPEKEQINLNTPGGSDDETIKREECDLREDTAVNKFLEETTDEGSSSSSFIGGGSFPEAKKNSQKLRLRYHSCCFSGSGSFGETGVRRQKSFSSPSINQEPPAKPITLPSLNDSVSTIGPNESPVKTYENQACQTDPEAELPVSHLLPFLFPVVCDDSLQHSASIPTTPPQKYSSVYPTAEDSMEKYMEYAIEYHRKTTEHSAAHRTATDEWDDPSLLRNHVLLLHMQLLFERRMRMMASERARKLAIRMRQAKKAEEEDRQTEIHFREAVSNAAVLKLELDTARKQKHALESQIADIKNTHEHQVKSLQQLLKESQNQQEMSRNHIHKLAEENKKLKQDYDRVCGQKVDLENSYRYLKTESETAAALRQEIAEIKHRFLVLGEVNHRLSAELQTQTATSGTDSHEMELFKEASKREIAEIRFACEEVMREKDAAITRIEDLENQIKEKNLILQTIKEQLKEAHSLHSQQIKEKERQYEELILTNHQLETEKFHLQQLLEKVKQEVHRRDRHSIPIAGRRLDLDSGQSPASTGSSLSNTSISGATGSPSELSVSLAMEVSEGFNESHFFNLEDLLRRQGNGDS